MAMSCLTVQVSELGTFLRTDDDQLMSFLIRMWEGQIDKFRHETVSGGATEIDNPWLNIIAATTPSWLKSNFPEAMIGGGLTSASYSSMEIKNVPSSLTPMKSFLLRTTRSYETTWSKTLLKSQRYLDPIPSLRLRENGVERGTQTITTLTSDQLISVPSAMEVISLANKPIYISSQSYWQLLNETQRSSRKTTSKRLKLSSRT